MCGRAYPVKGGIPNMLLEAEELLPASKAVINEEGESMEDAAAAASTAASEIVVGDLREEGMDS
jgi:hypothetical protein